MNDSCWSKDYHFLVRSTAWTCFVSLERRTVQLIIHGTKYLLSKSNFDKNFWTKFPSKKEWSANSIFEVQTISVFTKKQKLAYICVSQVVHSFSRGNLCNQWKALIEALNLNIVKSECLYNCLSYSGVDIGFRTSREHGTYTEKKTPSFSTSIGVT